MSRRSHWHQLYRHAAQLTGNTCVLTRAGGYCLIPPEGTRGRLNWLHENADPDDLPFVLEWLAAGDDEHPIAWQGIALDARRPRFGMSKVNVGTVAVCIFHSDHVQEIPPGPVANDYDSALRIPLDGTLHAR